MSYIFTSESVSEGHPDKLADQISDAIVDEAFRQDPQSRVAAETFTTTNLVLVGGEISTKADLDVPAIIRRVGQEVGYTDEAFGLNVNTCEIQNRLHSQSEDIAQGVKEGEGLHKELGAGDQGIMFGYACKQTPEFMPLPIVLSHQLVQECAKLRKSKELAYLRPDSKSQVSVEYEGRTPKRVTSVVISTQHDPGIEHAQIEKDIIEKLIRRVVPAEYLDDQTQFYINPTGQFIIGGPHGDAGLTGRKIIVDTYGGWAPHGGGAFSGKDCTKVDRSAAYMARYVAKNIVAAGLAEEIEIQLAYAIGYFKPLSINVNTKGSSEFSDEELVDIISKEFDLTPAGIIDALDLRRPIYRKVAAYGHFGRNDLDLPWEALTKVEALLKYQKVLVA